MNVKTQAILVEGFGFSAGKARGSTEDTFKFSFQKSEWVLPIVQLPGIPGMTAAFLCQNAMPDAGLICPSEGKASRLPWWAVQKYLEQDGPLDIRVGYQNRLGEKCNASLRAIIQETLHRHVASQSSHKIVFSIPNGWNESVQDKFLRSLPCGPRGASLLWRPVSILLACLNDQTESFPESLVGKNVLVLDFGVTTVEATYLNLKQDKGYIIPVRQSAKDSNYSKWDYGPVDFALGEAILSRTGTVVDEQLYDLSLGRCITTQILSLNKPKNLLLFYGKPADYKVLKLSVSERDDFLEEVISKQIESDSNVYAKWFSLLENAISSKSVADCLKNQIATWINRNGLPDIMVLGGALSEIKLEGGTIGKKIYGIMMEALPKLKEKLILLAANGAPLKGALLFGQREQLGLPTYFDVLPKYEVYVMQRQLGEMPKVGYTELVASAEVRGGKVWRPKDGPIKGFSIKAQSSSFELFVKRENEACKSIPADDFPEIGQDEPVLIYPEMKPASGYATVTIRPANNNEMFGRKRELVLCWEKGIESEPSRSIEPFSYPFVDWTEGRFAESAGVRDVIESFVRNRFNWRGSAPLTTAEIKLLENNILVPYRENSYDYTEPYRGAFGNKPFSRAHDEELVEQLASILFDCLRVSPDQLAAGSVQQKTIRLLGFMYHYAPKSFREYLTVSYKSGSIPTMNELIASGRTFRSADEVNSLLEYFVALPGLPKTGLGWYWWALFRCFFYNPKAATADKDLAAKFFQKMVQFLTLHKGQQIPSTVGPSSLYNQHKFCLCAILYALRLREVYPEFISSQTREFKDLNRVIPSMKTKVHFLQTMLAAMPPARRNEANRMGLNGVVLEFLNNKASADMVALLADFTKTIK